MNRADRPQSGAARQSERKELITYGSISGGKKQRLCLLWYLLSHYYYGEHPAFSKPIRKSSRTIHAGFFKNCGYSYIIYIVLLCLSERSGV